MRKHLARVLAAAALAVTVIGWGHLLRGRSLQAPGAFVPARTHDGQPDLQGVWQALNTAAWNLEDHNAELGVPPGRGVVDGGAIPYQLSALAKRNENRARRATADPASKCYLPGVPRATYMPFPFRIVQSPAQVTIFYEYAHTTRNIFLTGGRPRGPIEWWMGDSRGRWDGNTLVVDVVHFTDQTWLDRSGNFHSEALHVVERYMPTSPDHLEYEATIEDPKVFTHPWTMRMPLYRRQEARMELLEYECALYLLEQELTR